MGNQLDEVDTTNHLPQVSTQQGAKIAADDQQAFERQVRAVVPWLDQKTSALVAAIVAVVAIKHPVVQAAIVFGSLARREERPLDAPKPSDVDLLLLVTPDPVLQRLPYTEQLALWESVGDMQYRYRDAPREVEVTLVESTLADWDELFIDNIARDGRLLWMRDAANATKAQSPHGHAHPAATSRNLDVAKSALSGLDILPDVWRHLAEM